MRDPIERDEAIKLMNEAADFENKHRYEHLDNRLAFHRYLHGECCFKRAATKLKNMPAANVNLEKFADFVKVIRCKDCKHHVDSDRCEMWDYISTADDYWCKDGEKNEW